MEKFCRIFAQKNSIKYYTKNLTFNYDVNFESSARLKRYKALNKKAQQLNCDIVVTAHHKDDQIETLYMKKIDGADWISKIGIRESMGLVKRPMLDIRKTMIMEYAKNKNLKWIDDPSNNDTSMRRNHVRKIQLPEIIKKSPNFANMLLSEAETNRKKMNLVISTFKNNEKLLIQEISKLYMKINLKELIKFRLEEIKLFLYWSIKNNFHINISTHSHQFWIQYLQYLCNSVTGAKFFIEDITCFINRSKMFLIITPIDFKKRPAKTPLLCNKKWYDSIFKIEDINCFQLSKSKASFVVSDNIIKNGLYLRQWRVGDKMLLSTSKKHSLLSDLFIDNKFSGLDKFIHPIVVDSLDEIVWIPGIAHGDIKINTSSSKLKNIVWVQS